MIGRSESIIMDVVTRIMVPIIQIFAFYVIFHGHYSPGGGFQGGALLAASVLLQRVVLGFERSQASFPNRLALPFAIIGILLFVGTGLGGMPLGGNFLEHDQLPLDLQPDWLRNTGILLVEIGIAFAVMGSLVSIFDDLARGGRGEPVAPGADPGDPDAPDAPAVDPGKPDAPNAPGVDPGEPDALQRHLGARSGGRTP